MFNRKIIIDINEKTILNFQQLVEKLKIFVFFVDKFIRRKQFVKFLAIVDKITNDNKINNINNK